MLTTMLSGYLFGGMTVRAVVGASVGASEEVHRDHGEEVVVTDRVS